MAAWASCHARRGATTAASAASAAAAATASAPSNCLRVVHELRQEPRRQRVKQRRRPDGDCVEYHHSNPAVRTTRMWPRGGGSDAAPPPPAVSSPHPTSPSLSSAPRPSWYRTAATQAAPCSALPLEAGDDRPQPRLPGAPRHVLSLSRPLAAARGRPVVVLHRGIVPSSVADAAAVVFPPPPTPPLTPLSAAHP